MDAWPVAIEAENKENAVHSKPIIAQAENSLQQDNMAESSSAIVANVSVL